MNETVKSTRSWAPALLGAAGTLVALAVVAIWYFVVREPEPPTIRRTGTEAPAPPVEPEAAPQAIATPPAEPAVPLPPLDESDADVASTLTETFGEQVVADYLRPDNFIRNVVVAIDSLPRPALALERRPVQPTLGLFAVTGAEDALVLSEENYSRYTPFVTLVARTDGRTIVAIYRRYYPLLQEAYVELGNPDTVFETRVREVIDHLLATPEVAEPIALVQPNVLYEFKDPALEDLSAGQKILIRMGPEHRALIKSKLREIRTLLAR
ncbi:MAG TPA: DUF3014 domain-containing protein [Gammaproteobacteria bacterium]